MKKQNWQFIGWSLLYVLFLLSFMTPYLLFTFSFIMIPVLILFVKLDAKRFTAFYVGCLLIVNLLLGWTGFVVLAISLFLLPPVIVIGTLYKRKAPARTVLTYGTLTFLAQLLLTLVIGFIFKLNFIAKFKSLMLESMNNMQSTLKDVMPNVSDPEILGDFLVQVIPLYMIVFSLFFVGITHIVGRWILNRTGENIPGMPPVREWRLSRSFVWLYLLAFIGGMLFQFSADSLMSTLLVNIMPLLMFAFAAQAISFLAFMAHHKGWGKLLPVAGTIALIVFMPLLLVLYSLLGVFDVAFPLRERFFKSS
ncbi:DUF2232 domain-containing protein [Paenibacillus lutrae]|uniref:DUF2232 domain-containing protein n=1 Tax=Paenibacillus lutrae TaxID=2078573 RepID=A0A7X3K061_9BACL|nr:DUF2232 domain-containing protein [Paenibacillus lutrae]MVP00742.1 DUF2232 domain-containing protein [Paenibacillus lutrae]